MSDDTLIELKRFIEEESRLWAQDFIAARKAYLTKRKIQSSEELINSFETTINAQASREAVETLLAFADHGRYTDMKRLETPAGGADYITGLVDWMQRKGLAEKMKQVYVESRKLRAAPERVLVYIAWGIAKKRATGKFQRRAWYNKSKSAAITDLFNKVAAGIPDIVSEQITTAFPK